MTGFRTGRPELSWRRRGTTYTPDLSTATVVRATSKTYEDAPGHVVIIGPSLPAMDYRGLCVELAHTNLLLWSRNLANAAWTKTNTTATLTATGADGVANAASTLTATANNGFVAQALVASGARTTSVYLRRISGTGTIAISRDGGATYTDVTSQVGASYGRVVITSSVTNPEIRIRLGTSGDVISVDFANDEAGSYAHSAVVTTTASATANQDNVDMSPTPLPTTVGIVQASIVPLWSSVTNLAAFNFVFDTRSAGNTNGTTLATGSNTIIFGTHNGVSPSSITSAALTWTAAQAYVLRATWGAGNMYLYRDGVPVASDTSGTAAMPVTNSLFKIGRAFSDAFALDGFISSLAFSTA